MGGCLKKRQLKVRRLRPCRYGLLPYFFLSPLGVFVRAPFVMQRCFFQIMNEGVWFLWMVLIFCCLQDLFQVQRWFFTSFSQWLVDGFNSRLMK